MNLLLLTPDDHLDANHYRIDGRRFRHITQQLQRQPGESLRAGILGGNLGYATIVTMDEQQLQLSFQAEKAPPPATNVILLLALPRPKMLKRLLVSVTTLGIKQIILLNSYKVEKSYWNTPDNHMPLLQEKLLLGLEQARDTVLPQIHLEKRFRPFMEDTLPALCQHRVKLLADPGEHPALPCALKQPAILAIGPEGGWTDYERAQFIDQQFQPFSLGKRILRVETAVSALLGRLLPA